jgi:hypothetical protein
MTIHFIVDDRIYLSIEDYLTFLVEKYSIEIVKWRSIDSQRRFNNVVLVQAIPPTRILHKILNIGWYGLLNIEQLSRSSVLDRLERDIKRTDIVIKYLLDYSPANIRLCSNFKNVTHIFLPFQFPVIHQIVANKTENTVAFVGALSKRRAVILDELRKKGIVVHHIREWGIKRDMLISQNKVLLNIHYSDDYRIFESFRCVPWTFHPQVVVLSEESMFMDNEEGYGGIIWAPYDKLVTTVEMILRGIQLEGLKKPLDFIKQEDIAYEQFPALLFKSPLSC